VLLRPCRALFVNTTHLELHVPELSSPKDFQQEILPYLPRVLQHLVLTNPWGFRGDESSSVLNPDSALPEPIFPTEEFPAFRVLSVKSVTGVYIVLALLSIFAGVELEELAISPLVPANTLRWTGLQTQETAEQMVRTVERLFPDLGRLELSISHLAFERDLQTDTENMSTSMNSSIHFVAHAVQSLCGTSVLAPDACSRLKRLHTLEVPLSGRSSNERVLHALETRLKGTAGGVAPLRKVIVKTVFGVNREDEYFRDAVEVLTFMVPEVCVVEM